MKFTDGYWRKRAGYTVLHPAHLQDTATAPDKLTVWAATRPITHRGDTLNSALITIECTAPAPDVIRVTVANYTGGRPRTPEFAISEQPADVSVGQHSITSGGLTARFTPGEKWGLDFLDPGGRRLTGSGWKGMGVVTGPDGAYVHEQLDLGVGQVVYGLGERFGPIVKNGQTVDIWNEDGGTSSEQSYKNVPFYFTNGGYGVLVDHPGKVSFEVASEMVTRTQFSVAGQTLSYLVIYGPTPADVIRKYTALTGRPALPPAWSFGLWLTTSFTTDYDEETVNKFVGGMADRDLPLSVFHFDCFWMREFNWCDFEWDPRVFPDPEGMLKRLADRGLRTCLWINPYIAQRSPLFAEGASKGYLLMRPDGDVFQWDLWQAGMGLVDFTNPEARRWYAGKLRRLVDMGVDAFKSDFGERVPTDVVWHDGSDPERMHNYYTQLYNEVVFEVLRSSKGEGEAVLFARSATVGGQQFPVHWGGDNSSTFESMAESLRGGLSLTSSGFGFWSHDIGGFEGMPDPAVFKRWVAFGLLSSHSRLHGSSSYRVPWLFDEESVDVLRSFTHLKYRLMPYIFGAAVHAHRTGVPVMRSMAIAFPGDPGSTYVDRQYMLGDDLLVAPVFSAGGEVTYYVPEGRWTRYLPAAGTAPVIEGPRWVTETHGFDTAPLLVRPGAVIPVGARHDRPDYDFRDGVTLHLFDPRPGRTAVVVPGQSETDTVFTVAVSDSQIVIGRMGDALPWRVQLGDTVTEIPADQDSCTLTLG